VLVQAFSPGRRIDDPARVALGLYIAASLLMQHSLGPRIFGE
jgi:hypothetical protein